MKTINLVVKIFLLSFVIFNSFCYSQINGWQNLTGINTIEEIVDDHPFLWLATDGGLLKYNKNTEEITKFTKANASLPANRLGAIAKNNDIIWVGSRYMGIGLGRFDGNSCVIYNPNNSGLNLFGNHTALAIDASERLWVGELSHITSFDGLRFISYDCPVNPYQSNNIILQILPYENTIYVSGSWNISGLMDIKVHNKNKNLKFLIGSSGMVCDNNGKLYFSQGNGLICYDNGKWNEYTTSNSNIPTNKLGIGGKDQQGNIWFICDRGLLKFDGGSFELFDFPENNNPVFLTMCIDVNNTIWLGGVSGKLVKFKDNTWSMSNVNNNSLYSLINHTMAYDSVGNLWISTLKRTMNEEWVNYLLKYDGSNYYNFTKSDLLNIGAQLVFEDTLRCILAINNLLFDYKDSTWYTYNLKNNKIASEFVMDDKGIIWEASITGLKKYQDKDYTLYTTENSSLPTNLLYKLAIDNQNNFIISNYATYPDNAFIFEFDLDFETSTILYTSEADNNIITAFVIEENDDIWFGVRERSLQAEGEGLFKIKNGNLINFNVLNSKLPSNAVDVIHLDDSGTLWASANSGGIVRIKDTNWTVFNLYNSALPSLNNLSITSNSNDIAVLSVSEGITIFSSISVPMELVNIDQKVANIKLFPNPVQNGFYIKFSDSTIIPFQIKSFDISGKLLNIKKFVYKDAAQASFIYLSELKICENGIYLIQIQTNKGNYTKKIIVVNV